MIRLYAIRSESDAAARYPTLGWLDDGRAVVEASAEQLEANAAVTEYAPVRECPADDVRALACRGAHETHYVEPA